jgi:hypothetical protein
VPVLNNPGEVPTNQTAARWEIRTYVNGRGGSPRVIEKLSDLRLRCKRPANHVAR